MHTHQFYILQLLKGFYKVMMTLIDVSTRRYQASKQNFNHDFETSILNSSCMCRISLFFQERKGSLLALKQFVNACLISLMRCKVTLKITTFIMRRLSPQVVKLFLFLLSCTGEESSSTCH